MKSRLAAGVKRGRPAAAAAAVVDLTLETDDSSDDNDTTTIKALPSPTTCRPRKTKRAKKAPTEKRQARFRSSLPKALRDRFERALAQRMYLIRKEKVDWGDDHNNCNTRKSPPAAAAAKPQQKSPPAAAASAASSLPYYWKFAMLGSTGNIYDVCLDLKPTCTCPDFTRRGDLCKHVIFVLVRCVGLPLDHSLAYQKAYVTSELQDLYQRLEERSGGGDVWANANVQATYAQLKDDKAGDNDNKDKEEKDDGKVKRRPLEEQDCPICLEELTNCPLSKVTYCATLCGMNFHVDCMSKWKETSADRRGGAVTCPNCRAVEPTNSETKGRGNSYQGYVNMGRLQGQSPERDTSTYSEFSTYNRHRRWGRY